MLAQQYGLVLQDLQQEDEEQGGADHPLGAGRQQLRQVSQSEARPTEDGLCRSSSRDAQC